MIDNKTIKKHKKQLSEDLDVKENDDYKNLAIKKNPKKSSMNKTLFYDLKSYKNSVFKEEFDKNQSANEDDFKDDSIQGKTSPNANRKSIDDYVMNLDEKMERSFQAKSQ